MNRHVQAYLEIYGIKENPELAEKETLKNDDSYFYRIDDDLQGWYIKKREPSNDIEELVIEILMINYSPF